MTKKHYRFLLKNIFLLILFAIFCVALYFLVYYFFRQMAIKKIPVPAETLSVAEEPERQPAFSHLPPAVAVSTFISEPLNIPEVIPTGPPSVVDTSTDGLPSAALDLSLFTISDNSVSGSSSASLSFGSFQESFVAPTNIDSAQTTLYRDNRAAAMFFTPDYSWEPATGVLVNLFKDNFSSLKFNDFNGPYEDERCLGDNCLVQKNLDIFYNNHLLAWPTELSGSAVVAVSIGALTKNWLAGFTIKEGDSYTGRVFYFDGEKFIPLTLPAKISSPVFGLFGFGGEEADFFVIYGANNAAAYRVRGENVSNISRWFSARLMVNGFKPEIIRIDRGSDIVWYIYSSTLHRPQLIKLWQNNTADIVGEAVFDKLFNDSMAAVGFKLVNIQNDGIILLARLRAGDTDIWRTFIDRGFKNTQAETLVTNSITHDGAASSIVIDNIARAYFGLDQGSIQLVKFLFSGEGEAWRTIAVGADPYFSTGKIKNYRLKVVFSAVADRFYSPFLDSVLFDYYAKKF
ncbi:MAG: hypothetical protein WC249_04315 [Patescibacteria group bacterium]|jgi:hypothetical protein